MPNLCWWQNKKNWKILSSWLCLILSICHFYQRHSSLFCWKQQAIQRRRLARNHPNITTDSTVRVLYIVTSMREFDNGRRETVKGYDRFAKTILPILDEATRSMINEKLDVDVYLIANYTVSPQRRQQLRDVLPHSVGVEVWDEATPVGYAVEFSRNVTREITRGLARQHRYVIKDKILEYDFFVCFEDDMLVKGSHVNHFRNITNELFRLRRYAPRKHYPSISARQAESVFYGDMTFQQLLRTIPGFIRVEAALPNFKPTKNWYEQIPVDFDWNETRKNLHLDPSLCCEIKTTRNTNIPAQPGRDELYFWETSIDVLGVRKLPDHARYWDWILLQAGNIESYYGDSSYVMGDFWSGRSEDRYFGETFTRPDRSKGRYANNQGGWMGTRRQILEWSGHICHGGYLPPFRKPTIPLDGLDKKSVEYWSGGMQLTGVKGCNLQRILTLDPEGFSKQLLYHTSNNKQRTSAVRHRFSGKSIDQFWGQLNTVRKNAEHVMLKARAEKATEDE